LQELLGWACIIAAAGPSVLMLAMALAIFKALSNE